MKNETGFYNKDRHLSNNLKLKSILSIFIIGIFVFLGFASIDEGDPEVREVDCEFLPQPALVTHKCFFVAYDKIGNGIPEVQGKFNIYKYEKVNDNGFCNLLLKTTETESVFSDKDGNIIFILSKIYISNDDEILISFEFSKEGYYNEIGQVILHKSDLNFNDDIDLTEINKDP